MTLSQRVQAETNTVAGSANTAELIASLNSFIEKFVGPAFRASPGIVVDCLGARSDPIGCVVYRVEAPINSGLLPADGVAAALDVTHTLDVEGLRTAFARIRSAKRLRKSDLAPGNSTNVTLGIIIAESASVPLDVLASELDRLNGETPGAERADMVVVRSVGVLSYAVQFPGGSVEGDYLPPGPGALEAHIPPWYIVLVMRPAAGFALNRMLAILLLHLKLFDQGATLHAWNEATEGAPPQVMTIAGYQYDQAGELRPVPRQYYNDRYFPPPPYLIETHDGQALAAVHFVPWQDGGVIIWNGKLPLEALLVFLGKDVLKRAGSVTRPEGLISYALPIDERQFRMALAQFQRQSNMKVRIDEGRWTIKKFADEGSSSPFMTRAFMALVKHRETAFSSKEERDAFDTAFQSVLVPMLDARNASQEVKRLWASHREALADGTAAQIRKSSIHVEKTIDASLRQQTEAFINGTTRALKTGMQGLTKTFGVELGFLFQKDRPFNEGLAVLHATDAPLAAYLGQCRTWTSVLVERRNASVDTQNRQLIDS